MNTSAAHRTVRDFTRSSWFEGLARGGYAARGLLYGLIGVLAIRLAEGVGEQPANQQGALRTIVHQPFGRALLVLMAIGLGGYALWRATQALVGQTPEAGDYSAVDRIGAVGSAIAYGAFCVIAIDLLRGAPSSGGTPQKAAAGALGWSGGQELVGAVGVMFLAVAGYQAYLGITRRFLDDAKTSEMSRSVRRGYTALGVVGLLARAIAFGLIGVFFVKAAIEYDPHAAVGLDGALSRLTAQAYGSALLILVACGLIAFGIYSLADARFRKI